jgi:hypothetical protein
MNVETHHENWQSLRFIELMAVVPKELKFDKIHPNPDEPHSWIISMLKETARFPHSYDTWLGTGHTIHHDDAGNPYSPRTLFTGCILLPSVIMDDDFTCIKTRNGVINILSLFPLYKEEIDFKVKNGYSAFIDFLIEKDANEVIDLNRENFIAS